MKKLILLGAIIAIGLGCIGVARSYQPTKLVIHNRPKSTPIQMTHGIHGSYLDCTPYPDATKLQIRETMNTAQEMAKYNDVPDNTNNPELQALNELHDQEMDAYFTCKTIND